MIQNLLCIAPGNVSWLIGQFTNVIVLVERRRTILLRNGKMPTDLEKMVHATWEILTLSLGIFVAEDGEEFGWGGCVREESAELKAKFEGEMQSNPKKLLKYFDTSFRWSCCGMCVGEGLHGCDHHGDLNNPNPCACDYCRSGRPLPAKIFNKKTTHKFGLTLRRGPDPRSVSEAGRLNYEMGKRLGFISD